MTYGTTASTALNLTGSDTNVPGSLYYRTISPKKGRVTVVPSGTATLSGHIKSSADGTTYTTTVAFDTATGLGKMAEIDIPAYLQVQLATTDGDTTGSINVYLEVN